MRRNTPIYRLMLPIGEYDKAKENPQQGIAVTLPFNTYNNSYWAGAIIGARVRISRGLTHSYQYRILGEIMRDSSHFRIILGAEDSHEPIV